MNKEALSAHKMPGKATFEIELKAAKKKDRLKA
jgi:hypothetical protein